MAFLKSFARQFIYPPITALGLENLFSAFSKSNKLILTYHGVVKTPAHNVSVGPISEEQFEQHLSYFKKHFDVVSQKTIFEMYRNGIVPTKKTVAITFDDGYENNYSRVFPLLKKYNFPATMYIISSCINNNGMITWYDYLDFVKTDLNPSKIDTTVVGTPSVNSIGELKQLVKTLNIEQRQLLYTEIAKQVNIKDYISKYPEEYWKLVSAEQVKEMADSGLVEIGAHSHNHPNLGFINPDDARKEISLSKSILEDVIKTPVTSIAFPDGNYTSEVKQICKQLGFTDLLAAKYLLPDDEKDLSILPRWVISSTTTFNANIILIHKHFADLGF